MKAALIEISQPKQAEVAYTKKRRASMRRARQIIPWSIVITFILFSAIPIYWLVLTAFRSRDQIMTIPVMLLPEVQILSLDNVNYVIRGVINNDPIIRYIISSIIVSVISTFFVSILGVLCAYGIVRFKVGRTLLPLGILSLRFFPPIALVVPLFVIYKSINFLDTYHGLILLYITFNIPLAVWLMIGFIRSIPPQLEEAALVEGASHWQAFTKVALPLLWPGMAVTAIFVFIFCWNEYIFAFQLGGADVVPIPVYFARLRGSNMLYFGELATVSLLSLLPALAFAWVMQRYLIKGLTISKG